MTDASLILGYLNPKTFAGGISLDIERSRAAVKKYVAEPLGIDVVEAALGIHAIVNSNMAQTLRLVSIKRGFDPRELTFIPFGGAGPVHGGSLAEEIGITTMLIPPVPGVLSAMGLMLAPVQHDALVTYRAKAGDVDFRDVGRALAQLDEACATRMSRDGVSAGNGSVEYFAEMRYEGQTHELEVPIARPFNEQSVPAAVQSFHRTHEKVYNYAKPGGAVEFTMLRTVHSGKAGDSIAMFRQPGSGGKNRCTYRDACFRSESGFIPTPVYQRADLSGDFSVEGPAIVEQSDTTVVIYPGHTAHLDALGNLIVNVPTAVNA